MAFETATAANHLDLLHRIRSCITGLRLIPSSSMTFGGGDGTELNELRCKTAITEETITFTCNNAGGSRNVVSESITNNNFTSGLTGWTAASGTYSVSTKYAKECAWVSGQSEATITQTVTLTANTTKIDSGDTIAKLGWLQTSDAHADSVYMKMVFVDGVDADISSVESDGRPTVNHQHTAVSFTKKIPANTRKIRIEIRMKNHSDSTVHTANYNDILGYVTDVTLDVIEDELEFGITSTTTYSTAGKFYDGEDYEDSYLKFKFVKDATAWALTETITFTAVKPKEGQEWAVEQPDAQWAGVQYFENDGFDVTKKVRFNLTAYANFASSHFSIHAHGSVDYSSLVERSSQQGISPTTSKLRLDDREMDYWIFTSKRQVIVVAKILSWYMSAYWGYFNPFASPTEHPYPLYIASSSDTDRPYNSSTSLALTRGPSDPGSGCSFLDYAGVWRNAVNHVSSSNTANPITEGGNQDDNALVIPTWIANSDKNSIFWDPYPTEAAAGVEIRTLVPLKLMQDSEPPILLGEIEGMFFPLSSNNIAEEIISISGDDHYVFPIRNSTETSYFYAIKKVD